MAAKVTGIERTVRNLNAQLAKITDLQAERLLAAGLIIQREAMKRVPVEYGNLRASAYTRRGDTKGKKKTVLVGFAAAYAAAVHEKIEMSWRGIPRKSGIGVYWGPKGEAKFLENATRAKTAEVVRFMKAKKGK